MKAIYRIIIAIFAAAASAVSCSKDAVPVDEAQAADGSPRVITLSYGASVKSTLDGFTPTFSNGDRVMLSNGTSTEECTVSVDGGKATVTTNLPGVLKAVSPASAAVKNGGDLTYKVSATQNGTFTEAAIATAQNIISSAEFEIQVSILKFYVDKSIKVKSIKVESSQNIATTGSSDLKKITVGSGASYLHNVADDPQRRLCYAAVLPGVPASGLKFTSNTDTQGTVTRQSPASTVTLAANTLYNAFIPYYITIGSQKWAYCNIGAFLPEDYGEYFAWGDVKGQAWNGSSWSGAGFSTSGLSTYRFGTPDGKLTKYVLSPYPSEWGGSGEPDNKSVLELADDAAYVNWGSSWRIPTGRYDADADFSVLTKTCKPDWSSGTFQPTSISTEPVGQGVYFYNVTGKKGIYFVDGEGNKLFFPLASYGDATGPVNPENNGFYWSNTINIAVTEPHCMAADWTFDNGNVHPVNCGGRGSGLSIRPIFDNSLTMEDYDDGGDI